MKKQFIMAMTAACAAAAVVPTTAASAVSVLADDSSSANTIYKYLTGELGLNSAAACGILGNIYQESTLNPSASSSSYIGLCQWGGSRKSALISYCEEYGYDPYSTEGQVHYLGHELTGSYSYVLSDLLGVENSSSGAYEAAGIFCSEYEQPGNLNSECANRGSYAVNIFWPEFQGYLVSSSADEDTISAVDRDGNRVTVDDYALIYDYNYYINKYTDLKAAYADDPEGAFQHFVLYGMYEGRQASENFNLQDYEKSYKDLQDAFGNDLHDYYIHYIEFGYNEGRNAK